MPGSHGTFHWNELMARDVAAAKKFYADTIGWSFEGMPMPGGETYWLAKIGDQPVGGIFDISGPDYKGMPDGWMPYIAVDNVDARVKKAVAAGARVMKPAFDIPGVGRIVILMEPGGAGVGWITPAN
jgi:predicted enzyme related to lactoylglutathione lyase